MIWGRLQFVSYFLTLLIALSACSSDSKDSEAGVQDKQFIQRDLDEIRKSGKLRALTIYSPTTYFLYRGETMGFEYELLKRLADQLGVELEMVIARDIDSLFIHLNRGDVDLVAHGLTITSKRKKKVAFTDYLYLTHQVLVQRKPFGWRNMKWSEQQSHLVHDAIELIGDTISVRRNSSYFSRIQNLSQEIGGKIHIDTLPGHLSTEEIIKMVVDGEIKYTVADDNIASINASYYPELNIEVPISFSQRTAWSVQKPATELRDTVNQYLKRLKKDVTYYVIYNKYFKNERSFRQRTKSEFLSLNENKISQYDKLIRKYAKQIGWDWGLLASMIYQESQFNPNASSWAGASGLFQIMPATARELGVSNRNDPEQSIRGGAKYLKQIWGMYDDVKDSLERMKFTIASYNCGPHHVIDARKLAEHRDKDKMVWNGSVEKALLDLSYPRFYQLPFIEYGYVKGVEPTTYVEQILERYKHYQQFIKE